MLPKDKVDISLVAYYWEDGILVCKCAPSADDYSGWNTSYQIVVPSVYRVQIVSLAHDNVLSYHLGITKTYYRILKHFFWPGLKSDVSRYCRSCHACQTKWSLKLCSIPYLCWGSYLRDSLSTVLVRCQKSKSGHYYLLTSMCAATQYPEAISSTISQTKSGSEGISEVLYHFWFAKGYSNRPRY